MMNLNSIQLGSLVMAGLLLFIPHHYAMWSVIALLAFALGIEICRTIGG